MNGRERVLAVAGGDAADRPPFTAMLSLYGAKLTGCPVPPGDSRAGPDAGGGR